MEENKEPQVHCPKCNSTQITAQKKGFSGKKAVAGAVLTGGIGLLAGTIGSNKVKITCLNCGHVFNPGDKPIEKKESEIDDFIKIKKQFFHEYEAGNKEDAFSLLKDHILTKNYTNADEAYQSLKKSEKQAPLTCAISVIILAVVIALVKIGCN